MPEKETVYDSKMKYTGIYSFKELYKFCYNWLVDELLMIVSENKYSEKIAGDTKEIEVKWVSTREVTDYFRFDIETTLIARGLSKVEVNENGRKIETNKGVCEMKVKGILVRDYKGKFETSPFNKFIRGMYERWVIPARINEFKEKLMKDTDEFLAQSKGFLDLEGKKT